LGIFLVYGREHCADGCIWNIGFYMKKLFVIGLMILASFAELMAQDVEVEEFDSKCSCKATLADSIFSQFKRERLS
jgi:hypothetical protein